MVLDRSPTARFGAIPSASVVGQCAQVARVILQEAASRITADEGGRDLRLVNAYQCMQDAWQDEFRNVLLDKYSAQAISFKLWFACKPRCLAVSELTSQANIEMCDGGNLAKHANPW